MAKIRIGTEEVLHLRRGSGHMDHFCADSLPPIEYQPVCDWTSLPELRYPDGMNCAAELLDSMIEGGRGNRTVFQFPGGRWTYQHLYETSNRIARVLLEDFDLIPGNRVLLRGPNNPMLAACWFGVIKAGGVVVCTMPLLRERELRYVADKAEIKLALTDTRYADECEAAMRTRVDGSEREGARVVHFNSDAHFSLEPRMRRKPADFVSHPTASEDIAIIAFTSGTTGEAKGTMHSHRDIMAVTDTFPRYILDPVPDDLFCGSPPLAFTYALGGLLLFPMRFGASSLLLEHATPPFLIKAIQEYRPSICFTAPTAYRAMHALLPDHDVSSLRKCVSAGEALPLSVFEAWREATGLKIIDGIGATEMLHIFISAAEDDIKPGSTGKVVPGFKAKVIDENGAEVPTGTVGRLAVRGPTGCRYLANLEQQKKYVQNGWNLTGDSYKVDEDGYFWYQARTDDMIISGGYNIAGPEVENVLLEHETVAECAVVGVPDSKRGNIVKAYVVLRPGAKAGSKLVKELQDFVKARIAPYKYPRSIEFRDVLPRTAT
jgi:2-aminobenzoate-CoA ligase